MAPGALPSLTFRELPPGGWRKVTSSNVKMILLGPEAICMCSSLCLVGGWGHSPESPQEAGRGESRRVALAQGSLLEYSYPPNIPRGLLSPPPNDSPSLEWTSPAIFVVKFPFPHSPQVMSQEGSSQSHPYHQEEANEDQAWLHP